MRSSTSSTKAQPRRDQVFFRLDAAKFQEFNSILECQPTKNPGLERLLAVKPIWAWPCGADLAPDAMHREIEANGCWVLRGVA